MLTHSNWHHVLEIRLSAEYLQCNGIFILFIAFSGFSFNYLREVLIVIMRKWQMSIDKFMLFFRPLPLSTLRALHDDQYCDHEAGYDNCHDEDSDDNFDDGDAGLDLHDGGEEGLRVEEARQPHRDRQVEVCSPSFQLTVIIMMIILNITLMALLQKDRRITCWPSSIAFDADDNDVVQTWKENCI